MHCILGKIYLSTLVCYHTLLLHISRKMINTENMVIRLKFLLFQ